MRGLPSRRVCLIAQALSRGFWLLLLIVHVRALIGAWRYSLTSGFTVELVGGCILLTTAILVFALNLWGVSWLRLRGDRRSLVAICLVLAIIHLDCIDPGMRTTFVSKCVIVLATAPLIAVVPRMARAVRGAFANSASYGKSRLPYGRPKEEAWLDTFHPHCWVLASSLFRLRAPPA